MRVTTGVADVYNDGSHQRGFPEAVMGDLQDTKFVNVNDTFQAWDQKKKMGGVFCVLIRSFPDPPCSNKRWKVFSRPVWNTQLQALEVEGKEKSNGGNIKCS